MYLIITVAFDDDLNESCVVTGGLLNTGLAGVRGHGGEAISKSSLCGILLVLGDCTFA